MVVDEAAARAAAEAELVRLGFRKTADAARWEGTLDSNGRQLALALRLPARFPYVLPEISVDRGALGRQVPHVERSGKICISTTTGLLLDASRPAAIVEEAVLRARTTLKDGLSGANAVDLHREFAAYWSPGSGGAELLSFTNPRGSFRLVALGEVHKGQKRPAFLVAETEGQIRSLAERLSMRLSGVEEAWWVPLDTPPTPPGFDDQSSLASVAELIHKHVDEKPRKAVLDSFIANQSRLTFIFSFRLAAEDADVLFALRLKAGVNRHGFRAGHLPLHATLARDRGIEAERLKTQRADADFLRRRTGSTLDLSAKKVMIVGCGAVGGFLASSLADVGVGNLTLVDGDEISADNTMRHVLGLSRIGTPKVTGLKALLQARIPSVEVDARAKTIEDLVGETPGIVAEHDLLVLATGDHPLELDVGAKFRKTVRLVHAWIESKGVGGHVLVDGQQSPGCLGCLFEEDEVHGLISRSSFYAPGQTFTSTIGGCAGTFTPFGALDAQRAGIEAARVALRVLSGKLASSLLVSWFETNAPFEEGMKPSSRVRFFEPGARRETTEHAGCPRCR